jgi:hypothetical protein
LAVLLTTDGDDIASTQINSLAVTWGSGNRQNFVPPIQVLSLSGRLEGAESPEIFLLGALHEVHFPSLSRPDFTRTWDETGMV